MKILSNFDTGRAQTLLSEAEAAFGKWNAILVCKSQMFFYQHIGFPLFGYLLLLIIWAYAVLMVDGVPEEAQWWFLIFIVLIGLLTSTKLSKRRVDYKMDYLLITPKEVTKYDQWWVFHRDVENIPTDKIKSISVAKHWFIQSFFDIGSLVFLAEWERDEWDIIMDYIDAVSDTEKKIKQVMGMMSK